MNFNLNLSLRKPPASSSEFQDFWERLGNWLPLDERATRSIGLSPFFSSQLEPSVLQGLVSLLGPKQVHTSPDMLLAHAGGKGYAGYLRRFDRSNYPGAVVFPENESEVATLMRWATARDVQLLPWGSGSEPFHGKGSNGNPIIVVNMERMGSLLQLDVEECTARVRAGMRWLELKRLLMPYKLTSGHAYPSPIATVGGRVASAAFNLRSLRYGSPRNTVVNVRAITPSGPMLLQRPLPHESDVRSLAIGAHGDWNIITEVTLDLFPQPVEQLLLNYHFDSWDQAIDFIRKAIECEACPAWLRVIDAREVELFSPEPQRRGLRRNRGKSYADGVYLALGVEGESVQVAEYKSALESSLKSFGASPNGLGRLSSSQQAIWPSRRPFFTELWSHGIIAHTLAVAVPWSIVAEFRQGWEEALLSVVQATSNASALVLTSLYASGEHAMLYTLVLGRQQAREPAALQEQLSATHAIALETQRRWNLLHTFSPLVQQLARLAKEQMDPHNLLLSYHGSTARG